MCGFGGYFRAQAPEGDTLPMLRRMLARLAHRGPDGDGCWIDSHGGAGLAHARLAIIDLSADAGQPMVSPDGRYTLAFNGEIYNYEALRAQLLRDGLQLRTHSDTETLLHLLIREGPAALTRLRGMFAFAFWDSSARRGLLARDGLGIKPLYVHHAPDGLNFASELRALLGSGEVPFELDPRAVAGFFATGSVPEPLSPVAGVRVLPAGHFLEWHAQGERMLPFWEARFPEPQVNSREAAVALTSGALENSFAAHQVSDVPVGLFLSGGIDSSALLGLAHRAGVSAGLDTFSISVDDRSLDEGSVAAATARRFRTRHSVLRVDRSVAREGLQAHLEAMDVPSVDGFNTWLVSRLARAHGMKVVLSGLGGDEIFGGYPSFRFVPRLVRAVRTLQVSGLHRPLASLLARQQQSPRMQRVAAMLAGDASLASLHASYRGIFAPPQVRQLVEHFVPGVNGSGNAPRMADPEAPDARDAVSLLELAGYMRNQLLRDSDVMSMAHGLELRLPFVDTMLFDSLSPIDANVRLARGKRLLTAAVPEIPQEVLLAPKRGFRLPYSAWFNDYLTSAAGGFPVRAETWYQQWVLLVFTSWLRARRQDAGL